MTPDVCCSRSISTYAASDTPAAVLVQSTGVTPRRDRASATTSPNAGKIGFWSSGSTRPTRRARAARSWDGLSYPRTSSAVRTAARVDAATPGRSFRTRLTVASLTLAYAATSASRVATLPTLVHWGDVSGAV